MNGKWVCHVSCVCIENSGWVHVWLDERVFDRLPMLENFFVFVSLQFSIPFSFEHDRPNAIKHKQLNRAILGKLKIMIITIAVYFCRSEAKNEQSCCLFTNKLNLMGEQRKSHISLNQVLRLIFLASHSKDASYTQLFLFQLFFVLDSQTRCSKSFQTN